MKELPQFRKRAYKQVFSFITAALTRDGLLMLVRLEEFDDGHFRAVFEPTYFKLEQGQSEPTKSQWNTLKKHIKRADARIFIFKEHGKTHDGYYFIDFGYFLS